jgi:pimeloyl-ACP methyl ester carboxylesterase
MKIASNGIRIHVEEQGSGDFALVFLHYYGGSSRTWRKAIAALPKSLLPAAMAWPISPTTRRA